MTKRDLVGSRRLARRGDRVIPSAGEIGGRKGVFPWQTGCPPIPPLLKSFFANYQSINPVQSRQRKGSRTMIELSLQFTSDEKEADSPLFVSLFRPDSGVREGPLPYSLPLDDDVLADIHWYLETFSVWPTGPDYLRAEEIRSQLEGWGRALRDSIRPNADAADIWRQFMDAEGEKLLTIDATDPASCACPGNCWPTKAAISSAPVSVCAAACKKPPVRNRRRCLLPVRILVVVARPDDAGFIDPRAITRPLLDAVAGLGEAVVVEFLPEPTLKALSAQGCATAAPRRCMWCISTGMASTTNHWGWAFCSLRTRSRKATR
ncbi:MAG: hypothetical protein M5U34_46575 [Chloroflexi bacterium]|nr:hypothetical protein [Chloroflexota bacterium]